MSFDYKFNDLNFNSGEAITSSSRNNTLPEDKPFDFQRNSACLINTETSEDDYDIEEIFNLIEDGEIYGTALTDVINEENVDAIIQCYEVSQEVSIIDSILENSTSGDFLESLRKICFPYLKKHSFEELNENLERMGYMYLGYELKRYIEYNNDRTDIDTLLNNKTISAGNWIKTMASSYRGDNETRFANFISAVNKNIKDDKEKEELLNITVSKFNEAMKVDKRDTIYCSRLINDMITSGNNELNDFVKYIFNNLDDENLYKIFQYCNNEYETDFFSTIEKYFGDDSSEVKNIFYNAAEKMYGEPNEIIEPAKQGVIGDCWLLSGLNSLSYTPKGEEIIKEAIEETKDGYSVNFKGSEIKVNVSKEELSEAKMTGNYATYDPDIVLIEYAYEKLCNGIYYDENGKADFCEKAINFNDEIDEHELISGGTLDRFLRDFLGLHANYCDNKNNDIFDNILNAKNSIFGHPQIADYDMVFNYFENKNTDIIANIGFYNDSEDYDLYIYDINGDEHITTGRLSAHAWSIKSVEGDFVTITNPHDSSKEITVTRGELKMMSNNIEYYIF